MTDMPKDIEAHLRIVHEGEVVARAKDQQELARKVGELVEAAEAMCSWNEDGDAPAHMQEPATELGTNLRAALSKLKEQDDG